MARETETRPLCLPRFGTLVVLLAVAAVIVVANLSYEAGPPQQWPPSDASYGWPLAWYQCDFIVTPAANRSLTPPILPDQNRAHLARWHQSQLAGNTAIWLVMLAAVACASQWLLRRFMPARSYRPRILTYFVLILVAAPIVLANLSHDRPNSARQPITLQEIRWWPAAEQKFGWPFIWRWHDAIERSPRDLAFAENYIAALLAADLAVWLAMLSAAAKACEWLLRVLQPRWHYSLRTMLAGMAMFALLCACGAARWRRSNLQDLVISRFPWGGSDDELYLEYDRPAWLDLLGAEGFRRRVVGARIAVMSESEDELLALTLPSLRYLYIDVFDPSPTLATSLGDARSLLSVRIDNTHDAIWPELFAAMHKLEGLETLYLGQMTDSASLQRLADLPNLKSLSLELPRTSEEAFDGVAMKKAESRLAHLPALPRLESLDLRLAWEQPTATDDDLRQLAVLPNLKALNLCEIDITEAGMAALTSLSSLEELTIAGNFYEADDLRWLLSLKHLKKLHVDRYDANRPGTIASLPLDRGDVLFVSAAEIDDFRAAIAALRKSHAGIVIDSDPDFFDWERGELPVMSRKGL